MPTYYDHGLGIDTTSQITSSGDELAAAADYTEPENVDFAHFTWENQPISKTVVRKLRDEDFPQLSSSLIYITIPSGSPHNIYDSTDTVLVSGNAQENNDRDFTLDYTLRGATTDTGNLAEDTVWSFTTAALEFGNTEVVVGINSDIGIRDTTNMIISRTPTQEQGSPVVTITTETSATTASEITIEGTASDPNSLPFTVTYELSGARTDTGTAVGTDNWTFTEGLSAGDNRFDVTATNTWNLAGSDSLIVTYSPPVDGGGGPGDHFDDATIGPEWTISVLSPGSVTEPPGTLVEVVAGAGAPGTNYFSGIYQDLPDSDFDVTAVITSVSSFPIFLFEAGLAAVVEHDGAGKGYWADIGITDDDSVFANHHYLEGGGNGIGFNYTSFPVYLRIARVSDVFYTYYKQEGGPGWFEMNPGTRTERSGPVQIFLFGNDGFSGGGQTIEFDWFGNTEDLYEVFGEAEDLVIVPQYPDLINQWATDSGSNRWNRVNSGVETPNDSSYIYGTDGDVQRLSMREPLYSGTSTRIRVYARGKDSFGYGLTAEVYDGAVKLGDSDIGFWTGSYSNKYGDWINVAKTAAELADLEIKLTGGNSSGETYISELEIEIEK